MQIRRKHAESLGFKGSSIFPYGAASTHYYRIETTDLRVVIIGNLTPQTISQFKLTPRQFTDFREGRLSLVPPNCINPNGRPSLTKPKVLFTGMIESRQHLRKLLETVVVLPPPPQRKNAVLKV
jgi:hypothetical protein